MDGNIITLLIGALGGAMISALTGFLTTFINNRHSFRLEKEKDRYEYEKHTNRMLYKYLEELERDYYITMFSDASKTFHHADKHAI